MAGLLANACSEEPDALIALVRVCGGAPRVTGGSTRKTRERAGAVAGVLRRRRTAVRRRWRVCRQATPDGWVAQFFRKTACIRSEKVYNPGY